VLVFSIVLDAVAQAWSPFVLVAGLLLIGQVAAAEGVFEAAGAQIARMPLSPRGLLVALLGLVAVVTVVLNLDTSVVFLTPVLLHAARRRRLDERPFLYGTVFMSNSASLQLPASNLTNLLVLRSDPITGAQFATRMLPAWLAACILTTGFVAAFPLRSAGGGVPDAPSIPLGPVPSPASSRPPSWSCFPTRHSRCSRWGSASSLNAGCARGLTCACWQHCSHSPWG
jgi:Na+/H+ antiporter NhaD/arsenite permease-like protein